MSLASGSVRLLAVGTPATVVSRLRPSLFCQLSTRALSVTDRFGCSHTCPCTKPPEMSCVPPDSRSSVTVSPCVASSPCSLLAPSTWRKSPPAVNRYLVENAFDHCAMPPTPVVGTSCSSVMRPMERAGFAAGTARKLLWNVSKSVKTRACRSL